MENLVSTLKKKLLNPDLVATVREPADKAIQTNKFIAFSNSNLYIFSTDSTLLNTFYLFTLSKCEFTEKGIYLSFPSGKISFESPKNKEIKEFILHEVCTVQTDNELHQPGMEPFTSISSKPSLKSILNRMKGKAEILKIDAVNDIIDRMSNIILYQDAKIVFKDFKNLKNALPIILDVLPLCPFVNSIVVPSFENYDPFDALADFVLKNKTIEYFRIEGQTTQNFDRFIRALQMNDMKTMGLTFDGSHFNPAAIRSLASCISMKSIPSVGFRNALKPETVNTFYNFFLPGPVGNKLKFICIDSTPSVKVTTLLTKLTVLSVLSVTNCGLNIAKIFPALTKTRLRTVDLSGNTCTSSLADCEIEPPSSLVHIILNDITWGNTTLSGFFKYLDFYFKGPLKLGLAQAEASTEEWVQFYTALPKIHLVNLRELIWDNNPIHQRFFEFLMKNTKLHTLSISGCIHETEPDCILPLSLYLVSSRALKKLVISSNENAYLGNYMVPIIASIQAGNSLEYLDINNAKSGDDGINQLRQLMKQSMTLSTLHCDGLNPMSLSNYTEFIEDVNEAKKKRKIKFYFPQKDLESLVQSKKMKVENYETIKQSLMDDGCLYHGECALEFTELVKNLSSFKQMVQSPPISPVLNQNKKDNKQNNSKTTKDSQSFATKKNQTTKRERKRKTISNKKEIQQLVSLDFSDQKVENVISEDEKEVKTLDPVISSVVKKAKRKKVVKTKRSRASKSSNSKTKKLKNEKITQPIEKEQQNIENSQKPASLTKDMSQTSSASDKPESSSDSDFIFGTDVLDGRDFQSINSLSSASPRKQTRHRTSEYEENKMVLEKPSLTPDWTFPFRGQYFVDTEAKWSKDEFNYELSKLSSELKHTSVQPHPK